MKRQVKKRKEVTTVPPTLRRMALLVSICLLAACSKVTAENYAKVKTGMEYKEVTGILATRQVAMMSLVSSPANGATRRAISPSVSQVMS